MQQVELAAVQHLLKYLFQRKKWYNYGSYQGRRGGPCRMLKIWPVGTRMNSVSDTIHYLWITIHNNIWLSYITAWSVTLEEKIVFNYLNFHAVFLLYIHTVSFYPRDIYIYAIFSQICKFGIRTVCILSVCLYGKYKNCLKWQLFTLSIGSDHKKCEDCGISTKLNL